MSERKFKIDKAYELRLIYRKRRQYAKENLISQIIMWYTLNPDCTISLPITVIGHYQYRTVKAICDDLGYNLGYVSYSPIRGLGGKEYGSYTHFLFLSHIEYLGS